MGALEAWEDGPSCVCRAREGFPKVALNGILKGRTVCLLGKVG